MLCHPALQWTTDDATSLTYTGGSISDGRLVEPPQKVIPAGTNNMQSGYAAGNVASRGILTGVLLAAVLPPAAAAHTCGLPAACKSWNAQRERVLACLQPEGSPAQSRSGWPPAQPLSAGVKGYLFFTVNNGNTTSDCELTLYFSEWPARPPACCAWQVGWPARLAGGAWVRACSPPRPPPSAPCAT